MRLHNKRAIIQLERVLSNILSGRTPEEWIEHSIEKLLRSSGQDTPPLNLDISSNLSKSRRIKKISYKKGLPEWGRLINAGKAFEIEIGISPSRSCQWYRYALAHEVAHTLFYDINHSPIIPLTHVDPGNRNLEWLCGKIAKSLLIPSSWLRRMASHNPNDNPEKFSLMILNDLGKTFIAPRRLIAERLVEDLGMWDCVIVGFNRINTRDLSFGEVDSDWRLSWHTIPSDEAAGLFVPIGRREKGKMKFPRVRGSLAVLLESYHQRGLKEMHFFDRITHSSLNNRALGNLGRFTINRFGNTSTLVYIAVEAQNQLEMLPREAHQNVSPLIYMCIPLHTFSASV